MMTPWFAAAPHGSSSWPRCRQVFANACSVPSSSLVSRTLPTPMCSARWSPGFATWSLRPTQAHPPPKKCCCSQSNTAWSTYAARGSIRLWPNGSSDIARAAGSSGADVRGRAGECADEGWDGGGEDGDDGGEDDERG